MKTIWTTSKLKDLPISFIDGDRSKKYPKRSEFVDQGILFLNAKAITNGYVNLEAANYISNKKFLTITKGRLQKGDVVLTMRGNGVGKSAFFAGNPLTGLINAQMLIVRPHDESIDPRFFFYLLKSPFYFNTMRSLATGSAQPQLSITILRQMEVRIPSIEHQQRISFILSAYDDLIENNTRRIQILEEMAQRIYTEWFVHFRFPGHEKVKMVDSELGRIPSGWDLVAVDDISDVLRGRSYRSKDLSKDEGLPFVNLKCIDRDGGFRKDGIKWYKGDFKEHQKVFRGDIVMAVTDMTQERRIIARAAMVPSLESEFGIMSMDIVKVLPIEGINKSYLYSFFRWSSFPDQVKEFANGVNVLHLSPKHIKGYKFALPKTDLRDNFSEISTPIFNQIDLFQLKNAILRQTRDLLLPKLISGDIDVSEMSNPEEATAA